MGTRCSYRWPAPMTWLMPVRYTCKSHPVSPNCFPLSKGPGNMVANVLRRCPKGLELPASINNARRVRSDVLVFEHCVKGKSIAVYRVISVRSESLPWQQSWQKKKSVVWAKARSGWGREVAVARRGGGGNRGQRMKYVGQEDGRPAINQ
jgi:hypothetical protein